MRICCQPVMNRPGWLADYPGHIWGPVAHVGKTRRSATGPETLEHWRLQNLSCCQCVQERANNWSTHQNLQIPEQSATVLQFGSDLRYQQNTCSLWGRKCLVVDLVFSHHSNSGTCHDPSHPTNKPSLLACAFVQLRAPHAHSASNHGHFGLHDTLDWCLHGTFTCRKLARWYDAYSVHLGEHTKWAFLDNFT